MQFKNGLSVFTRCSGVGAFNIIAFHSPHSMTWSWLLSFNLPRPGEGRWFYFSRKTLGQEKWILQIARLRLGWSTQEPMWYRDMYWRLHEEREARSRLWAVK